MRRSIARQVVSATRLRTYRNGVNICLLCRFRILLVAVHEEAEFEDQEDKSGYVKDGE